MQLEKLLDGIEIKKIKKDNPQPIKGITNDSKKVKPGYLFFAIPGLKQDGANYIPDALKNGAVAVVTENEYLSIKVKHTKIIVESARRAMAKIASTFYGSPFQKLKMVGITGTNGKTTTAFLVQHILRSSGYKSGLLGTVTNMIGKKIIPASLTTPDSIELNDILAQMAKDNLTHCIMEVSSHAIALDRVAYINYDRAIYTNLSHDHLDFHNSMEEYAKTKMQLFSQLKKDAKAIINLDDNRAENILDITKDNSITYGIEEPAEFFARKIKQTIKGMSFSAFTPEGKIDIKTKLVGHFNVYNILAAIACTQSLGISLKEIKNALDLPHHVPGRFEKIEEGQKFSVIVDFAHSPDSLKKLLGVVRKLTKGLIILVFGCPGDRDKEKRPVMGKIAEEYADHIIVSTDDPHRENPEQIAQDITDGMSTKHKKYEVVLDRQAAIEKAIRHAKPNDTVILAGRGHENSQDFNGKRLHINDCEVARQILKHL